MFGEYKFYYIYEITDTTNGKTYIFPDKDSHKGGIWKMAKSPEKLNHKQTRMGTYDNKLNKIGE